MSTYSFRTHVYDIVIKTISSKVEWFDHYLYLNDVLWDLESLENIWNMFIMLDVLFHLLQGCLQRKIEKVPTDVRMKHLTRLSFGILNICTSLWR